MSDVVPAAEPVEGTPVPRRSAAEIEADLDATRASLAGNLDALKDYVNPANVVQRQVAKVTGFFHDEHGGLRIERVAGAAAVVVGVFVVGSLLRRRRG